MELAPGIVYTDKHGSHSRDHATDPVSALMLSGFASSGMTLLWPWMLWSLLVVPLYLAFYIRMQMRRRQLAAKLGSMGLLQNSQGRAPAGRRHWPTAFSMLGLALLLFALARPQMPLRLPRIEGTVMLAFDVSASMAAEDLEPTRMQAAKAAALEFIREQPRTVRIGILTFSEGGLVVQAPTNEEADLIDAIQRLAPQGGTSLGQGILAALNTILTEDAPPASGEDAPVPTPLPSGSFDDTVIVLLTDGENMTAPDPLEAAERAADYGIRIYSVGIGSAAGATLNIDGFTVFTQLDEELLRSIADITNGVYYRAESQEALHSIYTDLGRRLTTRAQKTEVTAIFAGAGMTLLLMGAGLALLWFGRIP